MAFDYLHKRVGEKMALLPPAPPGVPSEKSALEVQVAGSHYKSFKIQPAEFAEANGLSFLEGNTIKYLCRRKNSRVEDLQKAKHCIDLLLELEKKYGNNKSTSS